MSTVLKWLGIQCLLLTGGIMLMECLTRLWGYTPGDLTPNWLNFKPVDSLIVQSDFVCNADGLLVADTATMNQNHIPVNAEGFRTPEFSQIDSSKKKLLLIGDSFTWGLSANPIDCCFADLLRKETPWEIINLGIPVTDPPQYELLARKYLPLLKPDWVVVMFFMGNDLMVYDRIPQPNRPMYFLTNAGALLADVDGKHFDTAEQAYHYAVNEKYHLKNPDTFWKKCIAHSALLSRLYSIRFRVEEKWNYEKTVRNPVITLKYLRSIASLCKSHRVKLKVMVIPSLNEAGMNAKDYRLKYRSLFNDTLLKNDWVIPPVLPSYYTPYPDAHLNNLGHRKYADALQNLLKTPLPQP